jgi:hypothetical protein
VVAKFRNPWSSFVYLAETGSVTEQNSRKLLATLLPAAIIVTKLQKRFELDLRRPFDLRSFAREPSTEASLLPSSAGSSPSSSACVPASTTANSSPELGSGFDNSACIESARVTTAGAKERRLFAVGLGVRLSICDPNVRDRSRRSLGETISFEFAFKLRTRKG